MRSFLEPVLSSQTALNFLMHRLQCRSVGRLSKLRLPVFVEAFARLLAPKRLFTSLARFFLLDPFDRCSQLGADHWFSNDLCATFSLIPHGIADS